LSDTIVIVGGGQAGCQAVETLRREGFEGRLILISQEALLPYQRPPLSKQYLLGELPGDRLLFRYQEYYDTHGVELRLATSVIAIDARHKMITLTSGEQIEYAKLLLATGARPRPLSVPCNDPAKIRYLRNARDVDHLRTVLVPNSRLIIVGAGYIGLEVAAAAVTLGCQVLVLEMSDRVMSRVVASTVSDYFSGEHSRRGVSIHCNVHIEHIAFADNSVALHCLNGTLFHGDVLLAGVGALPEMELAQKTGLRCSNGIEVDRFCQTSQEDVFAAGDCASLPLTRYRMQVRLESVDNAFEQGKTAALNMLGQSVSYDPVPWFWSDQYEDKLLIAGLSQNHTQQTTRGDPGGHQFSVCYLKDGALMAIEAVNNPRDFMQARKLIAAAAKPDIRRLGDSSIPIKDCI
jgi:3-phenylpropionate/trans-cinnamate dioxygenase ferredoxin reductase component